MCIQGKHGFFASFYFIFYLYLSCVYITQCIGTGQRTHGWISFFLSTSIWLPWINLSLSGLCSKSFYLVSHLLSSNYLLNYRIRSQFLSCLCNKISTQKSHLGKKDLFYLTMPGYSPSQKATQDGRDLKQLATSTAKKRVMNAHMPTVQLFFSVHITQYPIQGNGAILFQGGFSHSN